MTDNDTTAEQTEEGASKAPGSAVVLRGGNAAPFTEGFHQGHALGVLQAEVESYIRYEGNENDPLERTLLAFICEIGAHPEAAPAIQKAIEAWNRD